MPETETERTAREAREREQRNGDRSGGRRYASPEEIAQQVTRLLAANGNDSQRTITQLINDNRTARDKLRTARDRLVELEKKLPQGAVVLVGDDAKAYEAFKALNLKPDEVKAKIELATKLEAEKQTTALDGALKEAAKLLGYNETVFVDLVKDKKLLVELRDAVGADQKPTKAPYMRPADKADTPLVAAKEFVETNLKGYVPALTTPAVPAGGSGTGFPAQSGGSSTAAPADTRTTATGTPSAPKTIPGQGKFMSPSEARAAQK